LNLKKAKYNRILIKYFGSQDYFQESLEEQRKRAYQLPPTPRLANVRKVMELPWQLLCVAKLSSRWDQVEKLLTDLSFLEAKVEAQMVFDLAADFKRILEAMPTDHPVQRILILLENALNHHILFVSNHPTTLFQCLWNSLWWYCCSETKHHSKVLFFGRLLSSWTTWRWILFSNRRIYFPLVMGGFMERLLSLLTRLYIGTFRLFDRLLSTGYRFGTSRNQQLNRILYVWRMEKHRLGGHWFRSLRPAVTQVGAGPKHILYGHIQSVIALRLSEEGVLISASTDGSVRFWNLNTMREEPRSLDCEIDISGISLLGIDCLATTNWNRKAISIWDLSSRKTSLRLSGQNEEFSCTDSSPDKHLLACGSTDGTIRVWDLRIGQEVLCLRGHESTNFGGTRPSSKLTSFLFARGQHKLKHGCIINAVAFSQDGSLIASGASDNTVRIWDVITGRELKCLRGYESSASVKCIAWFSDGRRLVSGSDDHSIRIWDCMNGICLRTLEGHSDWVWSVAVSPDGKHIASAGGNNDQTVCLWDAVSGVEIGRHRREESFPVSLVFVPGDQFMLAAGYDDGAIIIWVPHSEEPFTLPFADRRDDCETLALAFSKDARRILSVSGEYAHGNLKLNQSAILMVWDTTTGLCQLTLPLIYEGWREFWLGQIAELLDNDQMLVSDLWVSHVQEIQYNRLTEVNSCIVNHDFETEILDPESGFIVGWLPISFFLCQASLQRRVVAAAQRNHVYLYRIEVPEGSSVWSKSRLNSEGHSPIERFPGLYMDNVYFHIECQRKAGRMRYGENWQRPDQEWLPEFFWASINVNAGERTSTTKCPHCGEKITLKYVPADQWIKKRINRCLIGLVLAALGGGVFVFWLQDHISFWYMLLGTPPLSLIALVFLTDSLLLDYTSLHDQSFDYNHRIIETEHKKPEMKDPMKIPNG